MTLVLERLSVALPRGGRAPVPVVDGLDLPVGEGALVALVGESGAGKTMAALSVQSATGG